MPFVFTSCSHKVYMKIQEDMVKMLGENSWEDARCNYLDSSYTESLNILLLHTKRYVDL